MCKGFHAGAPRFLSRAQFLGGQAPHPSANIGAVTRRKIETLTADSEHDSSGAENDDADSSPSGADKLAQISSNLPFASP